MIRSFRMIYRPFRMSKYTISLDRNILISKFISNSFFQLIIIVVAALKLFLF